MKTTKQLKEKVKKNEVMNFSILKADSKREGFNFLAGINRPITPAHVSQIATSIKKMGVIRPVVISRISFLDGKPKPYIVDGQHLFLALTRLNMDIPYVEVKVENLEHLIETIALLNSSSKSWKLVDYINAWSYHKWEYTELERLFNLYNISRSLLAELLHTGIVSVSARHGGKDSIISIIKKGKLRIINKELAVKVLDYVSDLREITTDLGREEQKLIISLIIEKIKADGGGYNHAQYKSYLQSIKTELILASNDIDTVRILLSK